MGCGASTAANKVLIPQTNRDLMIESKLAPMLNPNHDFNINKKYSYLYYLIPNEYANKGIHRTPKYVSLVPPKELDEKKNEFWGLLTRVAHRRKQAMLGGSQNGLLLHWSRYAKKRRSSRFSKPPVSNSSANRFRYPMTKTAINMIYLSLRLTLRRDSKSRVKTPTTLAASQWRSSSCTSISVSQWICL